MKDRFLKYLCQTSSSAPLLDIVRGEGSFLFDRNGKHYLDFTSGIAVNNLGHNHPKVIQSVQEQIKKYIHANVYGEFILEPQVKLAELTVSLLPENLNCIYFVNSGSEAVEGAIKLARRATGRNEIIALRNSYHGGTYGALSVTGNRLLSTGFEPMVRGVRHIRFNSADDLDCIKNNTAAVIAEPIMGEAGVIEPLAFNGENFLQMLRKKCDENGALLIFDEAQTGIGRTGKMFAFEHYGVVPDILCLAKAFGGGMPLAAFISSGKRMKCLSNPPFGHITTFGGNAVSCAAGYAAVKIISQNRIFNKAPGIEKIIREQLQHPCIAEIRGKGCMLAMVLRNPAHVHPLITKCRENGLIIDYFLFSRNSVRIYPPLTISKKDILAGCNIILNTLNFISTNA